MKLPELPPPTPAELQARLTRLRAEKAEALTQADYAAAAKLRAAELATLRLLPTHASA